MSEISWLSIPDRNTLPEDIQKLFSKAEETLGELPNVFPIFSLSPKHFSLWFKYYDFMMRSEESALSRAEREMIALVVSTENHCEYCLASHSAYLRGLIDDHIKAEVLTHNYRRAELSSREKAILDFSLKLTKDSASMTPEDLKPLKAEGLNDEVIFEVAQIAAMFNFTNRLANALGWKPNDSYYQQNRHV
ncbi:MAG: peroxidase-related enzyme [Deinococcales bacterium]